MIKALKEILTGFKSLLTGMKITIQQFFKPQVTVHYPHEALKMPQRYRGHIVLVREKETGKLLCIACKSCEKACPSDCIVVNGIKREGDKKKSVTEFKLDFTKCSLGIGHPVRAVFQINVGDEMLPASLMRSESVAKLLNAVMGKCVSLDD